MLTQGQVVGNYRITRQLGQGGMGTVYAAEHQVIGRKAAIKVLHATLGADPALATRFLNEARAVNMVEHPGLVEVYEYGTLPEGGAFIIMEYLEGETLSAYLRRQGRLGVRAAPIALQIAQALAAAHACDIIHRDLKPDNVMLVRDRANPKLLRIKVLDFGIAKLLPPEGVEGQARQTRTGMAVGTPEYMSPEQCKGQPVDGRSDCYALGILIYEMLAGKRPFNAEFTFDLMRMHVHDAPAPLSADVPAELTALVQDLLRKDPATRPAMDEVAARLEPLAEAAGPLRNDHTDSGTLKLPGKTTPRAGRMTPSMEAVAGVAPTLPAHSTPQMPAPIATPLIGLTPSEAALSTLVPRPRRRLLLLGGGLLTGTIVTLIVVALLSKAPTPAAVKPPVISSAPPSALPAPPPAVQPQPKPEAPPPAPPLPHHHDKKHAAKHKGAAPGDVPFKDF